MTVVQPLINNDWPSHMWDFFLSHASEDKASFVRPLADALSQAGFTVWYDEYALTVGDSRRRSIEAGTRGSRFGIVVLSPAFFEKEWPQRELDALTAIEVANGKTILPIWHNVSRADVAQFSPVLADRLAIDSSEGVDNVVLEIIRAVSRESVGDTETAPEESLVAARELFLVMARSLLGEITLAAQELDGESRAWVQLKEQHERMLVTIRTGMVRRGSRDMLLLQTLDPDDRGGQQTHFDYMLRTAIHSLDDAIEILASAPLRSFWSAEAVRRAGEVMSGGARKIRRLVESAKG